MNEIGLLKGKDYQNIGKIKSHKNERQKEEEKE